jgi:hypothetical protein
MRNIKWEKIIHYLHGASAGTTENEHKMGESLKLRNLKLGSTASGFKSSVSTQQCAKCKRAEDEWAKNLI